MITARDIGQRVTCTPACEVHLAPQDRGDAGRLQAVDGDLARVAWDSGVTTWIERRDLQLQVARALGSKQHDGACDSKHHRYTPDQARRATRHVHGRGSY